MLNGLDLFSGIGGLSLALQPWVLPVAYCENDRYAQSILLSRMHGGDVPRAPIWDDITTLQGRMLPSIDILYGGFPCQDISIAGTGQGLAGERSGLFFELIRLVSEIRPRFVFLENVANITVRDLERVLLELSALRYDCRWTIISAAEFGAPHRRERWWLLAHSTREGLSESGSRETAQSQSGAPARDPFVGLVSPKVWQKTHTELRGMDDGVRPLTHRIRALGNAVVPVQAREAFMRLSGLQ